MSRERKPRVLVVEHMRAMVQRLAIRDDFRPPRPVYLTAAEHESSGIWKRPRRPEEMTENKPEAWAELYAVMGDVAQHAARVQEIARQQYHATLATTQTDGGQTGRTHDEDHQHPRRAGRAGAGAWRSTGLARAGRTRADRPRAWRFVRHRHGAGELVRPGSRRRAARGNARDPLPRTDLSGVRRRLGADAASRGQPRHPVRLGCRGVSARHGYRRQDALRIMDQGRAVFGVQLPDTARLHPLAPHGRVPPDAGLVVVGLETGATARP